MSGILTGDCPSILTFSAILQRAEPRLDSDHVRLELALRTNENSTDIVSELNEIDYELLSDVLFDYERYEHEVERDNLCGLVVALLRIWHSRGEHKFITNYTTRDWTADEEMCAAISHAIRVLVGRLDKPSDRRDVVGHAIQNRSSLTEACHLLNLMSSEIHGQKSLLDSYRST